MQIVIDIDEDLYARLFDNGEDAVMDMRRACVAIRKGKPLPKGHWLEPQQDDGMSDPIYYQIRCSECGFDLDPQTWYEELKKHGADNYCPNCGAKMTGSDKE